MAWCNEIEPFAVKWLTNLGHDVDARPIQEVDCAPATAHFFAGIGGWDYALQLAGWPSDWPVWTGSCPCQPFSVAGKQRGEQDKRHLWPEFRRLIAKCKPPAVFGEQVASRLGREWLAGVRADLEALGYAVGAADLCAASVGAPHIRQRLFWVAYRDSRRFQGGAEQISEAEQSAQQTQRRLDAGRCGGPRGLADTELQRAGPRVERGDRSSQSVQRLGAHGGLGDANYSDFGPERAIQEFISEAGGSDGGVGDAMRAGPPLPELEDLQRAWGWGKGGATQQPGCTWLECTDGKLRRTQPRLFEMVDGLPKALGDVCPEQIRVLEHEVLTYAAAKERNADESMRMVWDFLREEAMAQRYTGRSNGIYAPQVLLAFLLQLRIQRWKFSDSVPGEGKDAHQEQVRMLSVDQAAARPSYRRGLVQQLDEELADIVRELSSLLAFSAHRAWPETYHSNANVVSPLTNSLPRGFGGTKHIRGIVRAARTHRTGSLRGYGNAIVPQVAAVFIRAVMEAITDGW